jgi:hypothetical protein
MMTVVSSSLTTSLFIISRTVCSVRNTTKKQNSFHFVVSKKINNEEHTHAPQLCVVTFFFDFGTESRRLWGRSTSKTKEINKRWIVVELSFYWRSYSTTTRLYIYIYISMWWWYLDVYIRICLVGIYICVCRWLPAIKLSVRREGGAKKRNKQQQQQDNIRTKRLDGASIPSIRDAAQSLCRGMLGAGGYIIFIRCVLQPYTTHVYTVV